MEDDKSKQLGKLLKLAEYLRNDHVENILDDGLLRKVGIFRGPPLHLNGTEDEPCFFQPYPDSAELGEALVANIEDDYREWHSCKENHLAMSCASHKEDWFRGLSNFLLYDARPKSWCTPK